MTQTSDHLTIQPKILYFGTPVVLLSTENEDGTSNLAPMSSAWALGQVVVLGLGTEGRSARNLRERPDLVINLPSAEQWPAVERLAPLTGRDPVPDHKRGAFRYEPAKFAAAGLHPQPAELVRAQRVAECPLHLEARAVRITPDLHGDFVIVEAHVLRVHADPAIVVPGTNHVAPTAWRPLIYNFRHYFGLGPQLGHSFRSETPADGMAHAGRFEPASAGQCPKGGVGFHAAVAGRLGVAGKVRRPAAPWRRLPLDQQSAPGWPNVARRRGYAGGVPGRPSWPGTEERSAR